MRGVFPGLLIALSPLTALAQSPACAVPNCAPQPCYCPPPVDVVPESGPVQPEGQYVRGPESGEFAGPSESIGVRGFGIRLPEVRIDLPEIRLPHLVRYRRNPEMVVSESRAPFVRGPAMEFNQVAPESAPVTEIIPESGPVCVPPAPAACGSREQRLMQDLARKEAELQEMNRRFGELEAVVSKLAERQAAPVDEYAGVQPSSYHTPARLPRQDVAPPTTAVRSPARTRPSAPPPSAPVKRTVATRPSVPVSQASSASRFGLSTAEVADRQDFGDWSGAAKR